MLVVTGLIKIDSVDAGAARKAALRMMAETAKEQGCIHYRFYEDIGEEGVFRVYEEWENDASLKAHFATPHMAVFRAELGKLKMISREVKAFDAANIRDL